MIYVISWIFILFSPLALLTLSPDFDLINFLNGFYPFYLTILVIIGITLIVDFFYLLPTLLLKIGGVDIGDPKVSRAYKKLKRFMKNNG